MSVNLVVNGVSFAYPSTGDQQWGTAATNWASAVTSGMLQKAGGNFTLTAEVNFGPTYGLLANYFTSLASNPATAGNVRLANADTGIGWRNAANGANLLLTVNASNQLTYNGVVLSSSSGVAAITSLTGDVTGTGPGPTAATVALVGGSTAANVHAAELLANAATNANTASTIVKRDGSGNFSAGTITASLTGHSSLDLPLTGGTLTGNLEISNATPILNLTATSAIGTAGQPALNFNDTLGAQGYFGYDYRNDRRLRNAIGTAAVGYVPVNLNGGDCTIVDTTLVNGTGNITTGSPTITNISTSVTARLSAGMVIQVSAITDTVASRGTNTFTAVTGGAYPTGGGVVLDTDNQVSYTYTAYNAGTKVFTGVTPDPASGTTMTVGDHLYATIGIPQYASINSVGSTTVTMNTNATSTTTGVSISFADFQLGHWTFGTPNSRVGVDAAVVNCYAASNTLAIGTGGQLLLHNNDPWHTPNRLVSINVCNDDYAVGGSTIGGIDWVIENDTTIGGQSGSGYMYSYNAGAGTIFFQWTKAGLLTLGPGSFASSHLMNGLLTIQPNSGSDIVALKQKTGTTNGVTRHRFASTDGTRYFEWAADFTSGSEEINIQSNTAGALVITKAGLLQLQQDGLVGGPALSSFNEKTSGLYRNASNDWRFSINSTDRLQISAAGVNCFGQLVTNDSVWLATYFDAVQIATPSTPSASHNRLYFKSDNNLYMKNSSGTETQVNGGGTLTYGTDVHWVSSLGGYGSTGTKVLKWNTVTQAVTTNGDITYLSDATNGDTWTINHAGVYALFLCLEPVAAAGATYGISRNASSTTTNLTALAITQQAAISCTQPSLENGIGVTWVLAVNDVIRCQTNGTTLATAGTNGRQQFWIRRLI